MSKTALLKEFDNTVEGSSPSKTFFLLSLRCRIFCVTYMFAENSMC